MVVLAVVILVNRLIVAPASRELFETLARSSKGSLEAGKSAGLLVRDFSAYPGLAGCLRISIGTPEQNERLLAAVERS